MAKPTNFREQQKLNVRRTWRLIVVFVALFVTTGYFVGAAFGGGDSRAGVVGLVIGLVVGAVSAVSAWFGGGAMVRAASRAREIVDWKTTEEQRLKNVVEEMAIASGLPVPRCFIIEDSAPNAFACGRNAEVACVVVTRGLLDKLNREELQGVIGHELGHIRNRDILHAVVISVLVGVLVMMCDVFLRHLWWTGGTRRSSSSDRNGGGAQAALFLIGLVLAIVAPILARMIMFAMSREREYLADATSVEFTRNPEGLASALEKIAGDQEVLEVANRGTAHLYIANPIKKFEARAKGMFATHPPIAERARLLRAMGHIETAAAGGS